MAATLSVPLLVIEPSSGWALVWVVMTVPATVVVLVAGF
jgi:hypothetical protein